MADAVRRVLLRDGSRHARRGPVSFRGRAGRPGQRRLPAHGRRLAQNAAPTVRVPGRAGDRQVILYEREARRGANFRLVPTCANGQPAFGCYLDDRHAPIARSFGFLVLTLDGEQISAITFFSDTSVFAYFGLPRTLPCA